jgi:hypothetical protein
MITLLTEELNRRPAVISLADCRRALAMAKELLELEQSELLDAVL